jgi:N-ethylmaleimide reductase
MTPDLFTATTLGTLALSNRIVMAPMTRNRSFGNIPGELVANYYAQRASAGLIVTEGTSPSPNGLGYPRIPGIFSAAQIEGWKAVTAAVHARGGRIFLQMMHTGRIGHPANLPAGAELLGPSAVAAAGEIYTDAQGMQAHPAPREMSASDIQQAIQEFAQGARNAVAAGFDGIELHAANGYLLEQFLNPGSNHRSDGYGGSIENRSRFVLEVAAAASAAIGKERVGIRLSPHGVFNDIAPFPETEEAYSYLAGKLRELGLVYLHLVDHSAMGAPAVAASTVEKIRDAFPGTLILSGGYDRDRAEADLAAGRGQLIAFGRPFISNPDLPARLQSGAALAAPDMATFYTPGEQGYIDYPVLAE